VKVDDSVRTIKMTEKFICRPEDVYEAYTTAQRIMAFTQSPATFEAGPNGKFSMFDGSVHGENVELVPGEKIVQKWRFGNWEDGVYSTVTMTFKQPEPGNTILTLVQTGIPAEDKFGNHNVIDQTENGWKNLIFGRIRQVFGFGC
jgi:activator of HSP90 ATPase